MQRVTWPRGLGGRTFINRRALQAALGMLWLLDAGLQLQPEMLSRRFSAEVLGANTMGPPNVLTDLIHTVALRVAAHPMAWDIAFAVVQALIGATLMSRRFGNAALAASAAWGVMVWVVGEGLGGLLIPQASILTGAPGSALLYSGVSLMLLPRNNEAPAPSATSVPSGSAVPSASAVADAGLLGKRGSRIAWALAWIGPSLLELERANYAPRAISAQISAAASGEPWPVARMDHFLTTVTMGNGTPIAFFVLILGLLTGIWGLRQSTTRAGLLLGIALASIYWVAGQNFGAVFTGSSTDLNTGPAFILIALCLWPRALGAAGTTGGAAGAGGAGSSPAHRIAQGERPISNADLAATSLRSH